ncbi:PAS domain-containing hybrid sensor histidine kinase/response regulator [Thalassococcus sp. S3]|uniref:PAS domain-containing hybrid sensor histidine kinase/response regulator n=1 Tax=Thalassococcus sp. S3 TaxID=2017482 RepID=UPI0013EE4E13|nr:ATP-binding protein [Thalassococcus sp. S3]
MHQDEPTDTPDVMADARAQFGERALLVRYARGRVRYLLSRQLVTLLGASILTIVSGPVIGFAAVMLSLVGEIVDCGYLRGVPQKLSGAAPIAPIRRMSVATAAFQALTVSGCVVLGWLAAADQSAPLFAIAFLAGAAINAGLVLPFHKQAAMARLAIFVATPIPLFIWEAVFHTQADMLFLLDAAGAILLAYMVHAFLGFVTYSFERNKTDTLALMDQSVVLEETNQRLLTREREARQLSLVARYANDSVILSRDGGRIFWVNDAFTKITGYSLTEALGSRTGDLLNAPETDPAVIDAIAHAMNRGEPFRGEVLNQTKTGARIWVETNIVPVLDQDGEIEMTVAIERDVTEAKQQASELAEAKRAAEEGARVKAEFLATMSHEIRTPMNGIIGMADLLAETPMTKEQTLYADTIRDSGEALLTIINDVLDLSKLDADKMELSPVDFDLRTCVSGVLTLLKPQAEKKGLALEIQGLESLPDVVHGDDVRLRQVLVNLIGNAIKFTEKGRVWLELECHRDAGGDKLSCAVCDTGIGVTKDKLSHVFERFSQADAATTRRFGGTGLGLTISKLLIEKMGGEILASSTPGLGSRFSFHIPLREVSAPARISDGGAPAMTCLSGMQVLVAEDNKVNRLLIRKYLAAVPITLDFAHDGQEAVTKTAALRPDLVFMDMSMPVMSGLDATRAIRKSGAHQPIIVALTANAFKSDEEACLQAGMDGFLTKPIRRGDLLDCLSSHYSVPRV